MSDKAINSGDSDELQDLFDSIVSASSGTPPSAPEPAPTAVSEEASAPAVASAPIASPLDPQSDPARSMFASIGQLTRKVHDSLHDMGYDKSLEKAAAAIPDARDRLSYIATLTEQAANRTLNAVDLAQPMQNQIESESISLAEQWDKLFANQLSVEEFKQLATRTREHLKQSSDQARATNEQLLEIMMAQDFQDLTGQVIKKVVEMAKEMESGLLEFLVQFSPTGVIKPLVAPEADSGLENGPVYNSEGRADVVTNQEQVDDLLASLGF